jgi:perosamine synthetase
MTVTTKSTLAINGGEPAAKGIEFARWPATTKQDEELVLASLRQESHAFGPHADMLQNEFAEWNGNTFCLATNSGTAALHMCVASCDVRPGDEVVTTALSWTSSASAIIHHSGIPVFVDVDWDSMCMDPAKIEAAISEKTKAILVVHYWGVSCDMGPIMAIAKKHGLAVIEDACQAHGALYNGAKVATMGDVGAFSLNQNKNLCGGEGGLFVTNDEAKLDRAKAVWSFSDMRPADSGRDYHNYGLGWMYRTSDLPAALALSGLRRLDETNAHAQKNWARLDGILDGAPNLVRSYSTKERPTNGYAYVLRVDPAYAVNRGVGLRQMTEGIVAALGAECINVSIANWLLPAHAVFQAKNAFGNGEPWASHARPEVSYALDQFPVAQDCIDTCLWGINNHRPPNGPDQVDALGNGIRKVFDNLDDVPVKES